MFQAIVNAIMHAGQIPRDLAQLVAMYAQDATSIAIDVIGRDQPNTYEFEFKEEMYTVKFDRVFSGCGYAKRVSWDRTDAYHLALDVRCPFVGRVSNGFLRFDKVVRIIRSNGGYTDDTLYDAAIARLRRGWADRWRTWGAS